MTAAFDEPLSDEMQDRLMQHFLKRQHARVTEVLFQELLVKRREPELYNAILNESDEYHLKTLLELEQSIQQRGSVHDN